MTFLWEFKETSTLFRKLFVLVLVYLDYLFNLITFLLVNPMTGLIILSIVAHLLRLPWKYIGSINFSKSGGYVMEVDPGSFSG